MASKDGHPFDALMERMWELRDQYDSLLEARARNRRSLRDLADDGMLTDEQAVAVEEIYPRRAARGSAEAEPAIVE